MSGRREVCVNVFFSEEYDPNWPNDECYKDGSLKKFMQWLAGVYESIPAEYRDAARIEIDSASGYEDSHNAAIEIEYWRPETDEEMAERERKDAQAREAEERKERETYRLLAKKYAPK